MTTQKTGLLLIILAIVAISISILAEKNQNIVFNLSFVGFALGLFTYFTSTK